jgi:hypothetical protein
LAPGTAAAIPAIIARRVVSTSSPTSALGFPTTNVRGSVAVPAVEDGPGVDRHDLAVADQSARPDAMDDLAVDRDAQAAGNGLLRWP